MADLSAHLELSPQQVAMAGQARVHWENCRRHAHFAIGEYLAAGKLLVQARQTVKHGTWLAFLGEAGIKPRTAQRMMQLVRSGITGETIHRLGGLGAALRSPALLMRFEAAEAAEREHLEDALKAKQELQEAIAELAAVVDLEAMDYDQLADLVLALNDMNERLGNAIKSEPDPPDALPHEG